MATHRPASEAHVGKRFCSGAAEQLSGFTAESAGWFCGPGPSSAGLARAPAPAVSGWRAGGRRAQGALGPSGRFILPRVTSRPHHGFRAHLCVQTGPWVAWVQVLDKPSP